MLCAHFNSLAEIAYSTFTHFKNGIFILILNPTEITHIGLPNKLM